MIIVEESRSRVVSDHILVSSSFYINAHDLLYVCLAP